MYAGPAGADCGSWLLRDGPLVFNELTKVLKELEMPDFEPFYINAFSLGKWTQENIEKFTGFSVKLNPDVSTLLSDNGASVDDLLVVVNKLINNDEVKDSLIISTDVDALLEGGKNEAFKVWKVKNMDQNVELLQIGDFKMLVNNDCPHVPFHFLHDLDVLMLNSSNLSTLNWLNNALAACQEGRLNIGLLFNNALAFLQQRKIVPSSDDQSSDEKLLVSGASILKNLLGKLSNNNVPIQSTAVSSTHKPILLYHKIGFGSLNLYPLTPSLDSKEYKDFDKSFSLESIFAKNNTNITSSSFVLTWTSLNKDKKSLRLLFTGLSSQSTLFEGINKLKKLEAFSDSVHKKPSHETATKSSDASRLSSRRKVTSSISSLPSRSQTRKPLEATPTAKKPDNREPSLNHTVAETSQKSSIQRNRSITKTHTKTTSVSKDAGPVANNVKAALPASTPAKNTASDVLNRSARPAPKSTKPPVPKATTRDSKLNKTMVETTTTTGRFDKTSNKISDTTRLSKASQAKKEEDNTKKEEDKTKLAAVQKQSTKTAEKKDSEKTNRKARDTTVLTKPTREVGARPTKKPKDSKSSISEADRRQLENSLKTATTNKKVQEGVKSDKSKELKNKEIQKKSTDKMIPFSKELESKLEESGLVEAGGQGVGAVVLQEQDTKTEEKVDEAEKEGRKGEEKTEEVPEKVPVTDDLKEDVVVIDTGKEAASEALVAYVADTNEALVANEKVSEKVIDGEKVAEETVNNDVKEAVESVECQECDINAIGGVEGIPEAIANNDVALLECDKSQMLAEVEDELTSGVAVEQDTPAVGMEMKEEEKEEKVEAMEPTLHELPAVKDQPLDEMKASEESREDVKVQCDVGGAGDFESVSTNQDAMMRSGMSMTESADSAPHDNLYNDTQNDDDLGNSSLQDSIEGNLTDDIFGKLSNNLPEELESKSLQEPHVPLCDTDAGGVRTEEGLALSGDAMFGAPCEDKLVCPESVEVSLNEKESEGGRSEGVVMNEVVEKQVLEPLEKDLLVKKEEQVTGKPEPSGVVSHDTTGGEDGLDKESALSTPSLHEDVIKENELQLPNGEDAVAVGLPADKVSAQVPADAVFAQVPADVAVDKSADVVAVDKSADVVAVDVTAEKVAAEVTSDAVAAEISPEFAVDESAGGVAVDESAGGVAVDESADGVAAVDDSADGVAAVDAFNADEVAAADASNADVAVAMDAVVGEDVVESKEHGGLKDEDEKPCAEAPVAESEVSNGDPFNASCQQGSEALKAEASEADTSSERSVAGSEADLKRIDPVDDGEAAGDFNGDKGEAMIIDDDVVVKEDKAEDETSQEGPKCDATVPGEVQSFEDGEKDFLQAGSNLLPAFNNKETMNDEWLAGVGNQVKQDFAQFCGQVADHFDKLKEHRDALQKDLSQANSNNVFYNNNAVFNNDDFSMEDQDELETITEHPEIEEEEARLMEKTHALNNLSEPQPAESKDLQNGSDLQPVLEEASAPPVDSLEDHLKEKPDPIQTKEVGSSKSEESMVKQPFLGDVSPMEGDANAPVQPSSTDDIVAAWGEPMKLPAPEKPRKFVPKKETSNLNQTMPTNTTAFKKDPKKAANKKSLNETQVDSGPVANGKHTKVKTLSLSDKRSECSTSNRIPSLIQLFHTDITFISEVGSDFDSLYTVDFFKKVRSRCYFVGARSATKTLDQLLTAKQNWEPQNEPEATEVMVGCDSSEDIKTFFDQWMSGKRQLLEKLKVNVHTLDQSQSPNDLIPNFQICTL